MTQVSLSTSTTFNGDLNALVENQGTDVTFRIDLDEAAPAGGTRVYIDSDTVQIFNRLDLPAARSNPRVENIDIFSVRTNIDDSGLAFTINPGETFGTVTLTVFDNPEPDTFLPATFDGRVDAEFFVRTASEVTSEDAEAITVNGITVSDDITINPDAASSVVIFVDDVSQLPGSPTNTPPVADNDSYSTNVDTVLTVNAANGVLDGDTDADGDNLTATIENQPSNGSVNLSDDGSFTYTPNNGFSGNDSFTYIANDGTDDSNPATVSITVNDPSAEKPTVGITLDKSDVVEGESITLTINVDGEIPPEGLTVLINDTANAQNDITRSLTEFDVGNVQLTGIDGFPSPAEGDSGFFVTVTESTATVTLPVLDDGFDEDEANEVFTFEVIDEEAYEVDANASSVTISITDNEVSVNSRSSDFEDGTVQGWTVGQPGNHFAPPTNIPSGGPDGAEDNYLRAQSEGGSGTGSRLVWFNQSADWRGNYIEHGATSIKASLINEGSEDVVIRVAFDGAGGRFVTTEGITLTPGSGWQEATFSIEPEDLTAVDGGTDVDATLSNVSQIRFLNNATPSYRGAAVAAQVGVDDIVFTQTSPTEPTSGSWNPGDSYDLVTPPPTYEGELSDGEQANAEFVDQLEGQELLEDLQDGGYVIYFRHAQTERDFADQVTADVNNFSTQRVLSEFGIQQSLAIGEGFEISQIPYDEVITSQYGRAVKTAAIAFGEYQKDSALNFLPFEDYTDAQVEEMRASVTPLLTAVPDTGTNTIIVGHDDLFEAGTGIYPDPQGIAYLLKPDGSGEFDIIANLLPEEWVELPEVTPMPVDSNGGIGDGAGLISAENAEGWSPGDSFNLVTPPPTYEGELAPGEQANADFVDQLEGEELLEELQDGGYVIYFRHAQTERDYADQVTADVNNFSTQRVLSEFGVKQSLAIGEGFELSEIPIGSVTTSEYGRAVETAAIAFGEYQQDSALNFLPFEDYTDAQVEEMRASVLPLLTAVPETGTNSIIVGHDDLFEAGTGIYPDPQGIAYVLDPDGNGGFEVVANLLPEEWVELSGNVAPVVSLNVTPEVVSEADVNPVVNINFTIEGDIPAPVFDADGNYVSGGLSVLYTGTITEFFDQVTGGPNTTTLLPGPYVDVENNIFELILLDNNATVGLTILDDVIQEADQEFTFTLVENDGSIASSYSLNPEASTDTVTLTDGVEYGDTTVGISVSETELTEGSEFTVNFDIDGDIPAEGLGVLVQSPTTGALGEFAIFDENGNFAIESQGIAGDPIAYDGQGSSFLVTLTEPDASMTLSVFEDGPGEDTESLTFNLADGEAYEVNANASSVSLNISDIPQVSFEVNTTTLSEEEATLFTFSFSVDGVIPEGGLEVALGGELLPLIEQLDFSNFDFSNPQSVNGLTIGALGEDGAISLTLLEQSGFVSVRVFDDVVKEADANFDLMLLDGDGYSVNQEANGATITVTDGVIVDNPPVVSLSLSDSSVSEGEEFTVNFSVDGDVSEDNPLTVLVQSTSEGALGEFNIFNEDNTPAFTTTGIMGVPTVGDDTGSSFLVELTDTEASINLSVFNDGIGEGTETFNFALVDGERYNSDATNNQVALTIEETPAEVKFEADANGEVSKFAYDLTGAGNAEVTATVDQEALDITDAAFDNKVGFYEVIDENGGIDTDGDGVADFNPGDAGYAQAALENAVDGFALRLGGNPSDDTTASSFGDSVLQGGKFYAPFAIANAGDMTVADFLAANPNNDAASEVDDQVAYFAYLGANPDGANHLKSWGDGIFGFEDLPSNLAGVSDNDFNDAVFKFNFTA